MAAASLVNILKVVRVEVMETVKITRPDNNKPWGFRISGGKDFGVVLSIQRVNPGSLADEKGLKSGDALLTINGQDTTELRHKEAQDAILKAGNQLEITVQRGGSTNWKPASAKQTPPAGGDNITASILQQQYYSPLNMYSMNSIAETLTAHAEMIAPGVMGINFMKPEHPINTMSEVYRLVQEEEQNKAKSPTPPKGAPSPSFPAPRRSAPPVKTPPPVAPKPVVPPAAINTQPAPAPVPAPMHSLKKTAPPPAQSHGTCSDCGRYITSSFARVGDRILHEDCFRCSTCGASLQNIGYASINNKLYCEVHGKLAARLIASELASTPSPVTVDLSRPAPPPSQPFPIVPPLPTTSFGGTQQSTPLVPPIDMPSLPTPYVPPSQPFINLPHSPSSSGTLPFRSISPQPFKRFSGDYHRVAAPTRSAPTTSDIGIPSVPTVEPLAFPTVEPIAFPTVEPIAVPTVEPIAVPTAEQIADVLPCEPPVNIPQASSIPSGLTFRSISPQPFKRISGDYHRVTAPTSPTPGSAPLMPYQQSSGPLPFESKPYMPPGQALSSYQSSTQMSQTTQISQSFQQTTVSQQQSSQQYQMDYKQIIGQQKGTKFVWPPPKPEELLNEKKSDSTVSQSVQQTYSPLATQSSPPESHLPTSLGSSQPTSAPEVPASQPKPPLSTYVPPPLPSSFSKQQEQEKSFAPPAPEPMPEFSAPAPTPAPVSAPAPAPTPAFAPPAPTVGLAPGFAPVLAPVVDTESKNQGSVPQSGVPTGAGSRTAPRRGKGQLKEQIPGCRIPICADCGSPIRGPFVIALGKTWCPDHFICNNLHCKRALQDVGFVEEQGQLYCENCYEAFLAPICNKCNIRIKGDCLNALDKSWHPDCFLCAYCHKPFGNSSFYLEDGLPYCEKDWNELFTTKCVGCGYPIEAGDRWVEALNNNYHSQCFKCSICSKNLEGQSFFAKGGRPFCKAHAR